MVTEIGGITSGQDYSLPERITPSDFHSPTGQSDSFLVSPSGEPLINTATQESVTTTTETQEKFETPVLTEVMQQDASVSDAIINLANFVIESNEGTLSSKNALEDPFFWSKVGSLLDSIGTKIEIDNSNG